MKDSIMNGYKSWISRIALGSTAAAMAAITIGSLVVLPAKFDHLSVDLSALAVGNPVAIVRGELPVPTAGDARAAIKWEEQGDPDFVTPQAHALPAQRHKSSSHS
jgi:hypothetical protein